MYSLAFLVVKQFPNTEGKRDIKQSHQQEEKPDKQVEADQEEKDIPILKEINYKVEPQAEKVIRENQTNTSKKSSKEGSEQKHKAKRTVPQPFRLVTEKRMSRERRDSMDFSKAIEERRTKEKRGSIDFKDSQPKLSIITSNHKYVLEGE